MGVSVESGRRRSQMVDLNLVPFIDFMSCLIAFLMIAAVWSSTSALEVSQEVGSGGESAAGPPLTVHVRADGIFAGRRVDEGVSFPRVGGAYDLAALMAHFRNDRSLFPGEDLIVINTDDGVPYEAMVGVLDLSRLAGYPRTLLAGGPATVMTEVVPG